LIAYYKMIDQFNIEMLASSDQLLRYCNIFNIYMENIDRLLHGPIYSRKY
jgi:hypothetical protein